MVSCCEICFQIPSLVVSWILIGFFWCFSLFVVFHLVINNLSLLLLTAPLHQSLADFISNGFMFQTGESQKSWLMLACEEIHLKIPIREDFLEDIVRFIWVDVRLTLCNQIKMTDVLVWTNKKGSSSRQYIYMRL